MKENGTENGNYLLGFRVSRNAVMMPGVQESILTAGLQGPKS